MPCGCTIALECSHTLSAPTWNIYIELNRFSLLNFSTVAGLGSSTQKNSSGNCCCGLGKDHQNAYFPLRTWGNSVLSHFPQKDWGKVSSVKLCSATGEKYEGEDYNTKGWKEALLFGCWHEATPGKPVNLTSFLCQYYIPSVNADDPGWHVENLGKLPKLFKETAREPCGSGLPIAM